MRRVHPKISRYFLGAIFILVCASANAFACSCAGTPQPCESFWKTDAIFTGTVSSQSIISVQRGEGTSRYTTQQVLVRLSVADVFRGEVVGPELEIVTGMGGGDCGYRFEVAKQYLIYASKSVNENRLYTGICSRTRLLSEASDDLKYFYSLPPEGSGSTIAVSVRRYVLPLHDDSRFEITPLPSVKVTVDGGGKHFQGETDQEGQFKFRGLPPGTYRVRAELPSNPRNHSEAEVSVIDRGCAYREFVSRAAVGISGKVFDANGNPLAGVKVDLINADDALKESPRGRWRFTAADGGYSLNDIPPGRYLLGVNLINSTSFQCPQPRTYFPSAAEPSSATIITVEEARDLKNADIKLGATHAEQEIAGIVVWPDGRSAVRAVVALTNGSAPHFLIGQQKGVDSKGHFVLKGFEGCTYRVIAFTYGGRISADSDVIEEQRHAEPVLVTLRRDKSQPLKLVLTLPGFLYREDELRSPR